MHIFYFILLIAGLGYIGGLANGLYASEAAWMPKKIPAASGTTQGDGKVVEIWVPGGLLQGFQGALTAIIVVFGYFFLDDKLSTDVLEKATWGHLVFALGSGLGGSIALTTALDRIQWRDKVVPAAMAKNSEDLKAATDQQPIPKLMFLPKRAGQAMKFL